jgi:microsomal dipeptidase-like Zn-dependent dipeptidase
VRTPAEAREVIRAGKLAVILGIEVSNLFDCFLVPRADSPVCDAAHVVAQVRRYRELGIRAIFPVHKLDNAFAPGDGHRAVSEIGSFVNSGHWNSFTTDCPGIESVFDKGPLTFGGLNMPRSEYRSLPPLDMSGFPMAPIATLLPHIDAIRAGSTPGAYCQSFGLTELGELLMRELMRNGIIPEIDHLPQRAYVRAVELLEEADYPAATTHGTTYEGRIYRLGGVSKTGIGRCADPARPGSLLDALRSRVARRAAEGAYPAEGFGFDLNGFAGGPGPRFGERSGCSAPQRDPVTYPFRSVAGDVTFTEPRVGNRVLDFNTEGMVHIGLMPELIEDARRTGATDTDLEPLFRSAEAYLRMWEKAEARAAALSATP